jgi:hypothetical protein
MIKYVYTDILYFNIVLEATNMLKRNLTSELVKKFDEALEKILIYKKEKKYNEALIVIDDTFKEIFRLSSKFFNSFSDENLVDMIKTDGTINADKCIMMAKLLEEESEIFEAQENTDEGFYIKLKALNLFLEAFINKDSNCELQNYFSDIDPIIENVSEYKLPTSLQNKIMDYYTKTSRYDKAEDALYEILKSKDFSKDAIEKAINFYEMLLSKDNNELEDGDFSKEEAEEALSALKKKL